MFYHFTSSGHSDNPHPFRAPPVVRSKLSNLPYLNRIKNHYISRPTLHIKLCRFRRKGSERREEERSGRWKMDGGGWLKRYPATKKKEDIISQEKGEIEQTDAGENAKKK